MAVETGRTDGAGSRGRRLGSGSAEGGTNRPYLVSVLGATSKLPVSGRRDERIGQIASVQRGRVSSRQLVAAGLSESAIHRCVKSGRLLPLHRGVFAFGHLAPIEWGEETAALLAVSDRAVLSHRSAGALWGMCSAGTGVVHVLVTGDQRSHRSGICPHQTRLLGRQDVRIHLGLPVTSPARTLLDLAEVLSARELELAYDRALVGRIMANDDVAELLSRASSRAGITRLRALLDSNRGTTMTRSEAEERFLALVRAGRLPEPRVNARVQGYEVDFWWPDQRLVVEIDGYRFHSTRRAFEHDHGKDMVLRGAGLAVLRFTVGQMGREALAVVATVAGELARAAVSAS